ncbi:MAG: MobA/MobL family protein [Gallionella sp.]
MASYHFSIKSGKKGTAAEHARYITREGKHKKDDDNNDLVITQHGNLPDWTNGNPLSLWNEADKHERANGSVYREFEIALPNELSTEQQLEIAKNLIKDHVKNKPYQFALHCPTSSIEGSPQPHLHLMMSDRLDDGLDRAPEQFFKRYNTKHPARGGCKKDSGGKEPRVLKEQVVTMRKNIAITINEALEKNGHSSRVDHRSHYEKGLTQEPERHLGQVGIKNLGDDGKEEVKAKRQRNITNGRE